MIRIAFIGGYGVGKSSLTFTFSRYTEKKGLVVKTVNMDPGCKHIKYKADFDVRNYFSLEKVMQKEGLGPGGALKKIYEEAHENKKFKAGYDKVKADTVLIDTAGSLELFLLENASDFLREIADIVVFVCDYESIQSTEDFLVLKTINAIQTLKYALPTLTIVNKSDLRGKRKRQAKLLGGFKVIGEHLRNLMEEIGKEEKLIFVSAIEKEGFRELFDAINEIRCECGDSR
ncbi:ATP/GTP-binding protein [Candidatus Micrarchaeota archaeon]|nr:ATP/GTP-binding protein [Candidatus Micrarchaeota archaeon]